MQNINSFSFENQAWKISKFELIELKQFYGCKLIFSNNEERKGQKETRDMIFILSQIQRQLNFEYAISETRPASQYEIYMFSSQASKKIENDDGCDFFQFL